MRGVIWLPSLLLLAASLALAQGIDGTLTGQAPRAGLTLFDEIQSAPERAAFREVWDTREPIRQKELGLHFVDRFPGSVVLREAYELIARACVAIGDDASGLDWAQRSLRLIPENPFLLVMVADVAARQKQLDRAETSARDALAYLANAATPVPLTPPQWPAARDDLRATAHFVLGRAAAMRGRYAEAEQSLLDSLRLRPDDTLTLYVLGLARVELKDDAGAASAFAGAMRSSGPVAGPARQALHAIYDRSPQRSAIGFNEFAATLKWSPPEPPPSSPAAAVPGEYAGSAACRECHVREYERWRATGMSKMFRPYRPEDIIGDFTGAQIVSNQARAVADRGRHFIEIREGQTDRWTRYPVDYIIGSKWQQAYATRLADARVLVFPIQYSRRHSSWLNYWKEVDARDSARADISRFQEVPEEAVYQNTCASCHTSQLKLEGSAAGSAAAAFREGGVNCEMCHGPSLGHVRSIKTGVGMGSTATESPIRFGRLSAAQSTAICAQCHAQSAIHESLPDGAINYSDRAEPFYRTYKTHLPSNFSRTAFYRDGRYRATTFISEAFARSQCFRKGGATCASCHNPHPSDAETNPTSLKFLADPNQMCVQCHTALKDRPERHTRHSPGSEASLCVSCHMPRIMDALLFPARSHEIDDIPDVEMAARFGPDGSPNACLGCHRDRDVAWLQRELKTF
jgi:predicted CXXCH cytochrome family protein